jgi:hypothetical protein
LERGEVTIVAAQLVALLAVVLLLSNFTPGQTSQSNPVFSSVYWGAPGLGVSLGSGRVTVVAVNESSITAYFNVAYSTQVSGVTASRFCTAPNSLAGDATVYTNITFSYDSARKADSVVLSPSIQQPGWVCAYTIKVTDGLQQTTTWLGSVELRP